MDAFDLIVIGAGATGLAAARAARKTGRAVALVEEARPGGDCTHYGCVPSKTLLDIAHRVSAAREAQHWGLRSVGDVDFGEVMVRVHDVIRRIEQDESVQRLEAEGIRVVQGWARFTGPRSIEVDGERLSADRVVLATGAHAAVPQIPGLAGTEHLDNRTLFGLEERPQHLLVMGGGAIGVELSQAFVALGSRVTLVEGAPRLLMREEPAVSAVMRSVLERNGVQVHTGAGVERVTAGPTLHLSDGTTVSGSHLLVAVGRRPATAGMDLEKAGVDVGERGEVVTDRFLRTSADHVYAAGDCTTPLQFTHVGDEQGRLAVRNAFATPRLPGALGGRVAFDDRVVPWVTFTDPEVGRVGMTEQQAYDAYGGRARVAVVRLDELDRPRTAGRTDGYIKLIAGPRRGFGAPVLDQVVGMTAVCPAGGELAAQVAVAMRTRMLAGRLAQTVAPYPTYALGLRLAAARLFGEFGGATWRPAGPDDASCADRPNLQGQGDRSRSRPTPTGDVLRS
jgi:pyruvate/2-oxoglutarate dehydrogenase complex dihydrolipoamide dehydrogenase (E3) component